MTTTAPEKPKKASVTGYILTAEDRKKAEIARREKAKKRREAEERAKLGLSAEIAFQLEENAAEIVALMLKAGREGEWRALQALIHQHLGTPAQRVETRSLNVSASLEELRALGDADLEARLAALPPGDA